MCLFLRNAFIPREGLQRATGSSCVGCVLPILVGTTRDTVRENSAPSHHHVESAVHSTHWSIFPETMVNTKGHTGRKNLRLGVRGPGLIWNLPQATDALFVELCLPSRKIRAYVCAKLNTYTCAFLFKHTASKADPPQCRNGRQRLESPGLARYRTDQEHRSLTLDPDSQALRLVLPQ